MEYNASATKHLFWFVETRETARLLGNHSMDEVKQIVIDENLYQQKSNFIKKQIKKFWHVSDYYQETNYERIKKENQLHSSLCK